MGTKNTCSKSMRYQALKIRKKSEHVYIISLESDCNPTPQPQTPTRSITKWNALFHATHLSLLVISEAVMVYTFRMCVCVCYFSQLIRDRTKKVWMFGCLTQFPPSCSAKGKNGLGPPDSATILSCISISLSSYVTHLVSLKTKWDVRLLSRSYGWRKCVCNHGNICEIPSLLPMIHLHIYRRVKKLFICPHCGQICPCVLFILFDLDR